MKSGFEVARSDDAPLLQQDCVCSFKAPRAGKYIIEVRESSFGGSERCQYRLHIGDFPRPLVVTPAGGRPGEKIEATLVDASGKHGPIQSSCQTNRVNLITLPNPRWEVCTVAKQIASDRFAECPRNETLLIKLLSSRSIVPWLSTVSYKKKGTSIGSK